MSDELPTDLRWDAYRYIADEMNDDERLQFELRLADGEAACDAVEEAVELDEAIRLTAHTQVVRPPRSTFFAGHSVSLTAACAVCAACLALAFFAWRSAAIDPQRIAPEVAIDPERRESDATMQAPISIAWAELQSHDATERNDTAAARWSEVAAMIDSEHRRRSVDELESMDTMVPQWLLTATAGDAAKVKGVP